MKNKLSFVVLFTIIALVLFENKTMGQIVVVDTVTIGKLWKKGNSSKVTKDTKPKTFSILINDDIPELNLQIGAQTNCGVITFAIYDPTGKKRDNLSLKWTEKGEYHMVDGAPADDKAVFLGGQSHTANNVRTIVRGAFSATYEKPIQGKWTIKVSPDMADGYYNIFQKL